MGNCASSDCSKSTRKQSQSQKRNVKHDEKICDLVKKEMQTFKKQGKIVNPKTLHNIEFNEKTLKDYNDACQKIDKKDTKKMLLKQQKLGQQKVVNPLTQRKISVDKKTFKDLTK